MQIITIYIYKGDRFQLISISNWFWQYTIDFESPLIAPFVVIIIVGPLNHEAIINIRFSPSPYTKYNFRYLTSFN